ncbi:hypothetical protein [Capnocytophaga cynodegmi]|uniref:hypothetical protein n=1 Tax=Capnocytophaga cynodegmi TaxID=28189 RepID=UPI00385A4AE2
MLIRHDYESSEDTKMTFYSLYQHLSFGSQQQKEENKPKEQKQENTYTVKVKTPQQESGVLSLDSSTFIPLYSKVEIQTEDEKQGIYKVVFEGKTIVIPREKKDKKTLNNEGQVVFWGDKLKDRGLLLYSEARKNAPTKGVVKDGEKITILNKFEVQGKDKKHTWYKIKYQEKEGFVLEEHLATKPSENKENQKKDVKKTTTKPKSLPKFLENQTSKDEVVTCNIDVKGGEFIGWVGRQGLFNNPNYVATHIEVFTPDNGEDFISNKKDDGKNEKFYAQLPAKTILKNYIKRILFIPQSTKVKILAVQGDCVQLETLENLVKITDEQQKYQQRWYVDFVLRVIGEEKFRVDTHFSKEKKIYWVDKDNFKGVSIKKGDEIQLSNTISEVFFELPTSNIKKQEVIDKKVTVDLRIKTKKFDNHKWYYVVCHYHDKTGNRIERKGWIKDSDKLEKFSAYHWDKFGFKTYDAENHRMYPIKSVNNYEGTSEFIKKIIALIDKNKDGKIQNEELQASYNKPELSHIFSRMVCKHKSEWSYKWAKIKSDYEKFIKYHYPKAKQEYVDERLDEIQAKYDALYDFWDKLEFKTDIFWYFEPFAWVEQMKRVFGVSINHTFDKKITAEKDEVYINVIAPRQRHLQGPMIVFDSSGILFKTHSLCRGTNGNRLKAGGNGDTPVGKAATSYDKRHIGDSRYGNHGVIDLSGLTGEFLQATKNGRNGIAIHCGHTAGYKGQIVDTGKLMNTFGCIRIYNSEMEKLVKLYNELKGKGKKIYCYIEDYEGNISDVYKYYEMEVDPKDESRTKRTTTQ